MARLLIVDDEKSIRITTQSFLAAQGYDVATASSADEALSMLDQTPVDVVISDILMPGKSGIDLLHAIRARHDTLQVILMTGEPRLDSAAAALRSHAFDYLSKPLEKSALLSAVCRAVDQKYIEDENLRLTRENLRYQSKLEEMVQTRTTQLREHQAILTEIQKIAGIGSLMWSMNDDTILSTENMSMLTGWPPETFTGHQQDILARIVHPDDLPRIIQEKHAMATQGHTWPVEFRIIRPDGSQRRIKSTTRFLFDEGGHPKSRIAVWYDITELKSTEHALLESETRFRNLTEAAFEGIAFSENGRIVDANPQMAAMLGCTLPELLGKMAHDFVAPEHREMVARNIRDGHEGPYEHLARRKDGHIFPVEVRSKALRYGERAFRVTVIRDLTGHKAADQALRESESRLRTLFEESPIGIWEEDFSAIRTRFNELAAQGTTDWKTFFATHPEEVSRCAALIKVLDINMTSVHLFGASCKEEIPTHLPSYFTAVSMMVFRDELTALAEGNQHFEAEIPIRTPGAHDKRLLLSLAVVNGHSAALDRVLVSFIDITSRKTA
jgi:PAS domain S-box-containing protein